YRARERADHRTRISHPCLATILRASRTRAVNRRPVIPIIEEVPSMTTTTPPRRIDHVIILMLENRSFDHFFGFFPPSAGQQIDGLAGKNLSNRLDPASPPSETNPTFPASEGAPFAVHDKDGPSHSFNAVCVQLCNNQNGPSNTVPVQNNGFVRSYKDD